MLAINADQVFTIGIVNAALQPVVVRDNLRNVPAEGIYSFDPTAISASTCPTRSGSTRRSAADAAVRRLAHPADVPTLIAISIIVFTIIELPPGDYFESYIAELQAQGEAVDPQKIAFLRE